MARREKQHSKYDNPGDQALADERADMYKKIAMLMAIAIDGLEEIEAHVRKYPNGASTHCIGCTGPHHEPHCNKSGARY